MSDLGPEWLKMIGRVSSIPLWDKKPYRAYRMVTELTESLQRKLKSLQTLQKAYREKLTKEPCKLPVRLKISL